MLCTSVWTVWADNNATMSVTGSLFLAEIESNREVVPHNVCVSLLVVSSPPTANECGL